ncbi:hypothetical protein BGW41_007134 [Actinomortierella wolfii]|nr:hypothetical protein BGW41_007134 [Actinomortierella wolfii]
MKFQYLKWLLLFMALVNVVVAQQVPVAPRPATGAAFVKRKNRLYVFGGEIYIGTTQVATGQFFALELSKQWKSDSPAWTQLPEGPPAVSPSAVMSPDDKIFMYNGRRRFHFEDNTWRDFNSIFTTYPTPLATHPVTLGTDGTVLIAGGTFGSALTNQSYTIYSFATDSHVTTVYPAKTKRPLTDEFYPGAGYRAAWSESLKSVVFFGGIAAHMDTPQVQMTMFYQAETKKWSWKQTPNFAGTNYLACIASSEDGNSMFWYGGYNPSASTQSFSVLNLVTMSWTSLPMSGPLRESVVCTVAGDYFLVWGGSVSGPNRSIMDGGKPSTPVYIYQISRKLWVDEYIPSAEYVNPITPTSNISSPLPSQPGSPQPSSSNDVSGSPDNNSSNTGAIAGGVVGAVVLFAIIGFFVWRRRRQSPKHLLRHEYLTSSDNYPHDAAKYSKKDGDNRESSWTPPPPSRTETNRSPQESLGWDGTASIRGTAPDWYHTPQGGSHREDVHAYKMSVIHDSATDDYRYSGKSSQGDHSAHSSPRSLFHPESPSLSLMPPSSTEGQKSRLPRNPQVIEHRHERRLAEEQRGPQYIGR